MATRYSSVLLSLLIVGTSFVFLAEGKPPVGGERNSRQIFLLPNTEPISDTEPYQYGSYYPNLIPTAYSGFRNGFSNQANYPSRISSLSGETPAGRTFFALANLLRQQCPACPTCPTSSSCPSYPRCAKCPQLPPDSSITTCDEPTTGLPNKQIAAATKGSITITVPTALTNGCSFAIVGYPPSSKIKLKCNYTIVGTPTLIATLDGAEVKKDGTEITSAGNVAALFFPKDTGGTMEVPAADYKATCTWTASTA